MNKKINVVANILLWIFFLGVIYYTWPNFMTYAWSVLLLLVVAVNAQINIKKNFRDAGSKLNDFVWVMQNQMWVNFKITLPMTLILAPCYEEVLFRMPLLLLFSSLDQNAWWAIYISAGLFAFGHVFSNKANIMDAMQEKFNGMETNNLDEISRQINTVQRSQMKLRAMLSFLISGVFGVLAGYLVIKTGSIWWSVLLHAAWNFLLADIIMFLMSVISKIFIILGYFFAPR